ncbi:MAG: glycosyltransferase [Acidobacteria bacterium]|nr:MAG: glycosyltransferase [Acidobacteriota bacterium]REK01446.1 MAG: glycosyltransferase [Acidobacteriota bacterium]REK14402.1 MAG: glycosyltransferase [Acidobacteriota bacterium]REK45117.1 MAG: glycosyltransferase [Acidobacteriota bacterium]
MSRKGKKPLILIISNYYLPGIKSGGGTRTVVNTVDRLSDRYEFRIITRSYDAGEDKTRYSGVETGAWTQVGNAQVLYLDSDSDIRKVLPEALEAFSPSLVYANSFFSPLTVRSLRLRRIGKLGEVPFLLAPCGELSSGARKLKRIKKTIFARTAVAGGLYDDIVWKASSEIEADEIRELRAQRKTIIVAPDLPPRTIFEEYSKERKLEKERGKVNLVFLSRIDRKKNLKWLFDNLEIHEGSITLHVFGTIEDEEYYRQIEESSMRTGIRFEYKGYLKHDRVPRELFRYHFKIMPTLGENFGHVFLEALAAGCPLLISDRTPWLDLEEKSAGWALPLETPKVWNKVIGKIVAMENEEYQAMSRASREYAEKFLSDPEIENATVELFDFAIGSRHFPDKTAEA